MANAFFGYQQKVKQVIFGINPIGTFSKIMSLSVVYNKLTELPTFYNALKSEKRALKVSLYAISKPNATFSARIVWNSVMSPYILAGCFQPTWRPSRIHAETPELRVICGIERAPDENLDQSIAGYRNYRKLYKVHL